MIFIIFIYDIHNHTKLMSIVGISCNLKSLFFIPSNYYFTVTVLDFVCFVMHFCQLLHTFTVNKRKSG